MVLLNRPRQRRIRCRSPLQRTLRYGRRCWDAQPATYSGDANAIRLGNTKQVFRTGLGHIGRRQHGFAYILSGPHVVVVESVCAG